LRARRAPVRHPQGSDRRQLIRLSLYISDAPPGCNESRLAAKKAGLRPMAPENTRLKPIFFARA
jgi:hypothetical protein